MDSFGVPNFEPYKAVSNTIFAWSSCSAWCHSCRQKCNPCGWENDVPICMSVYVKHYYLYLYLCEYILDIYIYMWLCLTICLCSYTHILSINIYVWTYVCMYIYIYMHVCTCVIIYLHGWHCLKIKTRFIIDSISYVQTQRLHNRERKGTCFFDILHVEAKLCVYIYIT